MHGLLKGIWIVMERNPQEPVGNSETAQGKPPTFEVRITLQAMPQADASVANELLVNHGSRDDGRPNGHQCNVMVGMGKRKPSVTYRLNTAILCEEMLVDTSLTPSEW